MITDSQIKQLRDNIGCPVALEKLLDGWANENYAKAAAKEGKIELTLKNGKGEERKVVATPIAGGQFAFHKDVWNASAKFGYVITHIRTRLSLCSGNQKNIRAAVKYLADNVDFWPLLDCDEPLKNISPAQLDIMRKANEIGRGIAR